MSLTSILRSPTTKAFLKGKVRNPGLRPYPEVLVPPGTGSPQRMGIACDYAVRAGLRERFSATANVMAQKILLEFLATEDEQLIGLSDRLVVALEAYKSVEVADGGLRQDAAAACLVFATFEAMHRSGWGDWAGLNLEVAPAEVSELQELYALVPWDRFRPDEALLLNPEFGEGSMAVGGADADLLVDDTVIEIKTRAKQALNLDTVRQLVAYALLANRFGPDGSSEEVRVEKIGVYLSRAGHLHAVPLDEALKPAYAEEVLDFLLQAARRQ